MWGCLCPEGQEILHQLECTDGLKDLYLDLPLWEFAVFLILSILLKKYMFIMFQVKKCCRVNQQSCPPRSLLGSQAPVLGGLLPLALKTGAVTSHLQGR